MIAVISNLNDSNNNTNASTAVYVSNNNSVPIVSTDDNDINNGTNINGEDHQHHTDTDYHQQRQLNPTSDTNTNSNTTIGATHTIEKESSARGPSNACSMAPKPPVCLHRYPTTTVAQHTASSNDGHPIISPQLQIPRAFVSHSTAQAAVPRERLAESRQQTASTPPDVPAPGSLHPGAPRPDEGFPGW